MSRRSLFRLAKDRPEAVKRFANRTLWDFAILDELIERLPLASEAPCHQQRNLAEARAQAARARAARAEKAAAKAEAKAAEVASQA